MYSLYLRQGIPVYKIVDYDGKHIRGTLHVSELQKVSKGRDDLFRVQKVFKCRKRNDNVEVYVK